MEWRIICLYFGMGDFVGNRRRGLNLLIAIGLNMLENESSYGK